MLPSHKQCGTPTHPTTTCPGPDVWTVNNIRLGFGGGGGKGGNIGNNKKDERHTDTIIKKWTLSLTQLQKYAHEMEGYPRPYKKSVISSYK